jgi:hypothetical protein
MNTSLLRMARRHRDGTRYWTISGAAQQAKLVPAARSSWNVATFYWPESDGVRGVRLDWHRSIARKAAQRLISEAAAVV